MPVHISALFKVLRVTVTSSAATHQRRRDNENTANAYEGIGAGVVPSEEGSDCVLVAESSLTNDCNTDRD
jgi:hypothetical protein